MTVDQQLIEELSLSLEEYRLIVEQLGREPNEVELGMFGAMWSEHCGYKNSKPLLRLLPEQRPAHPHEDGRRERGRGRHRRRHLRGDEDRVAQPPVGNRAVRGRSDRRGRHRARHLRDGRAPNRHARLVALRPALGAAQSLPLLRRRRRHRRLRQLPGHSDDCRRGQLRRPVLGEPAGQRHVRRDGANRPPGIGAARRRRATSSCSSAPTPGATASAAPTCWRRACSTRGARSCGRRCRSATHSWRSC